MARLVVPIGAFASSPEACRDSVGSSAVPTATPMVPSGSWFTRSAKYRMALVPAGSSVAMKVSTSEVELHHAGADQAGRHLAQ